MSVREEYEKLRKKYNLPQFDELDHAFDIADLETDGPLLREIRHRVEERLEFVINTLDPVCQPDTNSVRSMIECGFFGDKEKKQAFLLKVGEFDEIKFYQNLPP